MTFAAGYKTSVNESETITAAQPIHGWRDNAGRAFAIRPDGRGATATAAENIERS